MFRLGLVVLTALVVALVAILFLRPGVAATSSVDPDVAVECTASTGADERRCGAWGDAILDEGSPTTTFEAQDVVRLRLHRTLLGFGDTCRAEWFLGRYPDDVAWSESVACADG